jgi:diadenosine tetraphosphate (Ap4A) HIT family hydrolase
MKKTNLLNLKNARVKHQLEQMKEIQRENVCPFCIKYFEKYHKAPILLETKYWLLTKNDYPYKGSKHHLLLVHKKHIEHIDQISVNAFKDLAYVIKFLKKKNKIIGGTFLMRFGDNRYTGATITHLHAHIISGGKENKKPIKTKVGFFK